FTIEVLTTDIWDAGTEVNNGLGAPFNTAGGVATDTLLPISQAGDLSEFLGDVTPTGVTITDLYAPGAVVATITITRVPEPASAGIAAAVLGVVGLVRRR
ncbi:MAG: PEP-CTERM sorting domain-containing protein, partial [Planctomycetota bacterium]